MEKISSKNNTKIKDAVRLCVSADERRKEGKFVLEGLRLCKDAFDSGVIIETVFVTAKALLKFGKELGFINGINADIYEISEDVSKKISDVLSPQGVFCVCKALDKSLNIVKMKNDTQNRGLKYLALDRIQDPSNLGAISRTAEALGLDGIIVSGGCDIYNQKALRASMGAFFRLPVYIEDDLEALICDSNKAGFDTYAALASNDALKLNNISFGENIICVVGNEGSGVSKEVAAACKFALTIPMAGGAESLNAAAAAAILIWEMIK